MVLGFSGLGAPKSPDSDLRYGFRWTPHPVIVSIKDNRDYVRVLFYSYYTTITGWGVLLRYWFYLCYVFTVYGFEFGMQKEVLPLYGRFMMYPVSLKYTAGPILETL